MVTSPGIPRKRLLTFELMKQQEDLPSGATSGGSEECSSKLTMGRREESIFDEGLFLNFWWGLLLPPSPYKNADVSPANDH